MTQSTHKPEQQTWTKQTVFDPMTINESLNITLWERLRLLFRKNRFSFDTEGRCGAATRYKQMDGKTYILEVKRYRI
jgi:hypothetical protein